MSGMDNSAPISTGNMQSINHIGNSNNQYAAPPASMPNANMIGARKYALFFISAIPNTTILLKKISP